MEIGATGVVMAAIEADRVWVGGHVRGPVTATDEVAVREGGHLSGDVRAPNVAIDDGGALHGGIDMDFDLPEPRREGHQ